MAVLKLLSMPVLDKQLALILEKHPGGKVKNWWLSLATEHLTLEVEIEEPNGASSFETRCYFKQSGG